MNAAERDEIRSWIGSKINARSLARYTEPLKHCHCCRSIIGENQSYTFDAILGTYCHTGCHEKVSQDVPPHVAAVIQKLQDAIANLGGLTALAKVNEPLAKHLGWTAPTAPAEPVRFGPKLCSWCATSLIDSIDRRCGLHAACSIEVDKAKKMNGETGAISATCHSCWQPIYAGQPSKFDAVHHCHYHLICRHEPCCRFCGEPLVPGDSISLGTHRNGCLKKPPSSPAKPSEASDPHQSPSQGQDAYKPILEKLAADVSLWSETPPGTSWSPNDLATFIREWKP